MKTKQSKCLDLRFGEVHLQSVHWTGSSFIQKRIRSKDLRRLFPTFSLFDRCTVRLTNESPAMSIGSAWIHSTNWKTVNLGRSNFVEFRFDCFRKKSRASSALRLNLSFLNSKNIELKILKFNISNSKIQMESFSIANSEGFLIKFFYCSRWAICRPKRITKDQKVN